MLGFAVIALGASSGTLKLTWQDCGDSSTHAVVKSLTPDSITLGQTTPVVGFGDLDEDVTGGTYTISVHASIVSKTFSGDISKPATFDLPLGLGHLTWDGLTMPLAKGPKVKVGTSITLSGALPAKLAKAALKIEAVETNGHKLLCLEVNTVPALELEAEASQCTDADTAIWTKQGKANFGSDMTACGEKCLGKQACVTTCIQGKESYSAPCSGCFGDLAQCTAAHCLLKCIHGRTPDCVTCVEAAHCDSDFTTCSSFDPAATLAVEDSCSGTADPAATAVCYHGDKSILGIKEDVAVKIDSFAGGKGVMDLTGSGALKIACSQKNFSKSGQEIKVDLSSCLSDVKVKDVKYCSDQDSIAITVEDSSVPLPVHATLTKVACPTVEVLV